VRTGFLGSGHAVAAYLLPWFQGVSLDLKKKLSATLVLAFLSGSQLLQREETYTPVIFS